MKNVLLILILFIPLCIHAQRVIIWEGGTPGKENVWNEPKNWDANQLPEEDSHVVIKFANTGHFGQPIIDKMIQIASLEIQSGATLRVTKTGSLLIDGTDTYSKGITIYGGELISEGEIVLKNIDTKYLDELAIDASNMEVVY